MNNVETILDKNYNITDVVFVIDKSGSMSGLEKDTIGGFNSFIKKQQKLEGEMYVTLVVFDTICKVVYNREHINKIGCLKEEDYIPSGCTALYDAIGLSIDKEIIQLKELKQKDLPSKVIFNIITDGEENSSKEYSLSKIKSKIKELEEDDWSFAFLGANIDSYKEAKSFGINNAANYSHNSKGLTSVYSSIDKNVSNYRNACNNYVQCCMSSSFVSKSKSSTTVSCSTTNSFNIEKPTYDANFSDVD